MTIENIFNDFIFKNKIDSDILLKLQKYYEFLIEYNKNVNLTSIIDKEEFYIKHFYDSILPFMDDISFLKDKKILDIGSGAGFPGVVLKIFSPSLDVYLCESIKKKAIFLDQLINILDLDKNTIRVLNVRCENIDKFYYNFFDIVTARAVTSVDKLFSYSEPLLKKGGYLISYKGMNYKEELNFIKNKKFSLIKLNNNFLPNNLGERNNLFFKISK